MKARVGDRLVRDGGRVCEIIRLHHADGSPPYVVRWLSDGHIALLYPGPYTRLVRQRGSRAGTATLAARQAIAAKTGLVRAERPGLPARRTGTQANDRDPGRPGRGREAIT